jgi:hypothetical protein
MTDALNDCSVAVGMLVRRIAAEVRTLRESGRLNLRKQGYVLRPDLTLHYSFDPMIRNFALEEAEEDIWDHNDLESFITERIEPTPEYLGVLRIAEGNLPDGSLVKAFAWRVAYDSALGVEHGKIERHVETMVRDLGGGPREFVAKIWLTGITLTEDVLTISKELALRRPTRSDMQERVSERMVHYAHAFQQQVYFSCIGELRIQARQPVDVQRAVDRLVTALRLFRLGSVSSTRYDFHSESFISMGSGRLSGQARAARTQYMLSEHDVAILGHFLGMLMPALPSSYDLPRRKPDFLSTALEWYGEAMLAMTPIEGTVAWAIACLEALFLDDDPSTEVLYRLTQRTVSLLRCFGYSPLEMRQTMKIAYDVRSKYVHGALQKRKVSHEMLTELFRQIAEYARASCLVWAQLVSHHAYERKAIRDLLEDSLIDDDARIKLQSWCSEVEFPGKG